MIVMYRALIVACVLVVATDAFIVPLTSRSAMFAPSLKPSGERVLLPLRMDADAAAAKAKAAKAKAAKAKAAKATAATSDETPEKEETPEEKAAREAKEKAEAEAKAKAEAEEEVAKKKAEEEAARAAKIKAAAIQEATKAVNMAGQEFGYGKERFVVRWVEEAIVEGDGNSAVLTEEIPDLCGNIGIAKALLECGDAKCVAMTKALDQLQAALTGEVATPASDLVPAEITIKNRPGLVDKSFAREKAQAAEEYARKRSMVAQGRIPRGQGGRLW